MRHRVWSKRFGRTSSHQRALLARLVCALVNERRIVTTLPKARVARSLAEKMMTLAKGGTLAERRRAIQALNNDKRAVKILFSDLAPNYKNRQGGYCRIIKTDSRRGDSSSLAVLEWVDLNQVDRKKKKPAEEGKKEARS